MKERYFIKYLATFLIPLILPLIILGSLSFITTQRDMKNDINKSSQFLLLQSQRQLEMILAELDTLKLALYQNAKVYNELAAIMQQPAYTYESSTSYQIIYSYLNALTSSKSYIQSIYFYVDNPYKRFVSSQDGLTSLDRFKDTQWFTEFMSYEGQSNEWTSLRELKLYNFEAAPTQVVSIFNVIVPQKIGIIMNIRPKYIETILKDITTYSDQQMLVLDEDNQIIFSSSSDHKPDQALLESIASSAATFFDLDTPAGMVNVTKIESTQYDWKYVSIIPHSSLYEAPSRILSYTLVFAGLSFLCGLALTYYLTRRNYRQLLAITSLIRSAENNRVPLKRPRKVNDEYSYIIENMVAHFIEHRYIQTQLSEKKYRLQAMELKALQSQINPHFLYNTLNSIYWETVGLTGNMNKASDMIEDLSDMLSYSFSNPTTKVTWREEIANTMSYINIQKKRYKDKFHCIVEYDEEITEWDTMRLMIQPLVENSLYHGIKEKEGVGLIKIKINRLAASIRLVVIDNGIGMKPERLAEVRQSLLQAEEQQGHIGLSNTNKRLLLMYDSSYRIAIRSRSGRGTTITIELPVQSASP
jgi:two-component system sensor histidine kinase YesM